MEVLRDKPQHWGLNPRHTAPNTQRPTLNSNPQTPKVWEALRDKAQHWELGSMQGKVSVGDSIGEQEVVELTKYMHTVVATEDLEAIEINKDSYR